MCAMVAGSPALAVTTSLAAEVRIKGIDVHAFEFLQRDIPECGNDVSAEVLRIPLASFVCREGGCDIDEPVAR